MSTCERAAVADLNSINCFFSNLYRPISYIIHTNLCCVKEKTFDDYQRYNHKVALSKYVKHNGKHVVALFSRFTLFR